MSPQALFTPMVAVSTWPRNNVIVSGAATPCIIDQRHPHLAALEAWAG
jgi:hypothetical protein